MSLKHTIFSILFIIIIGCAQKSESTADFKDLEGNSVLLSDFKGKKILVNFWATWCVPCIEEMPAMAEAQELLASENYIFLFATTDEMAKIDKFKEKHQFPFQYVRYQSSLDKLNIHALPATFIYNTKGELVKRWDGAQEWNSKEMIKQLKSIE
ncbi:TlpA family protein disulfide reductase [Aureibaculum sp. A20]|uniref:TlpA family protein disulfide reductase n=1 Tax=Aureibaculum flavum TaxID=2795986 RepID=A0ABS0WRB7_9FLAO|nr:TlpA disulfide reductase family protein [Aureibaculum flavum]MBJ2174520.1 TlpA family protein disulfide reductase [Aureibaculum flavum]